MCVNRKIILVTLRMEIFTNKLYTEYITLIVKVTIIEIMKDIH